LEHSRSIVLQEKRILSPSRLLDVDRVTLVQSGMLRKASSNDVVRIFSPLSGKILMLRAPILTCVVFLTACSDGAGTAGTNGASRPDFLSVELERMLSDPTNAWVSDESRRKNVLVDIPRMSAYIARANELTCGQLSLGEVETGTAVERSIVYAKNAPSVDKERAKSTAKLALEANTQVLTAKRTKACA